MMSMTTREAATPDIGTISKFEDILWNDLSEIADGPLLVQGQGVMKLLMEKGGVPIVFGKQDYAPKPIPVEYRFHDEGQEDIDVRFVPHSSMYHVGQHLTIDIPSSAEQLFADLSWGRHKDHLEAVLREYLNSRNA